MEYQVTVLRAESRPYKNKEGTTSYFNQVQVLMEGELVDMSCTKDIADYVLKNIETLKGKEITVEAVPKGFTLTKLSV